MYVVSRVSIQKQSANCEICSNRHHRSNVAVIIVPRHDTELRFSSRNNVSRVSPREKGRGETPLTVRGFIIYSHGHVFQHVSVEGAVLKGTIFPTSADAASRRHATRDQPFRPVLLALVLVFARSSGARKRRRWKSHASCQLTIEASPRESTNKRPPLRINGRALRSPTMNLHFQFRV